MPLAPSISNTTSCEPETLTADRSQGTLGSVFRWARSAEGLIRRTLGGAEWKQLADFVSPSFFDVMPARALLRQGRELLGNASDRSGFRDLSQEVEAALERRGVAVELHAGGEAAEPDAHRDLDDAGRRARGQRVLEIYFGQLVAHEAAVIDLRLDRFLASGEALAWHPGPYWIRWDGAFLDAMRRVYAGFYSGDEALFDAALADLGLEAAGESFRHHFGDGDQRDVRFDPKRFQASFHDVFVRCRDAGASLHPNFLALGCYLAALYDHLGALGGSYDVRGAYERVRDTPS